MKVLNLLSEWLKKRRENSRRNRYIRLNREAFHRIQVMEYDNRLFLCFDGMPIAEEKLLDCPIEDAVNEVQRKTYGNKEFRFNELIRKLRSAKVMDEATNKNPLSVHNSQTQK